MRAHATNSRSAFKLQCPPEQSRRGERAPAPSMSIDRSIRFSVQGIISVRSRKLTPALRVGSNDRKLGERFSRHRTDGAVHVGELGSMRLEDSPVQRAYERRGRAIDL